MAVSESLGVGYDECERIVRENNPNRAVSIGFAPADRRKHLFALYAFHLETGRIRDLVSQPLPGEIRLQWWRDRILADGTVEEAGQGSPLAMAVIDTIRRYELPADAFDRYLEARIFDLYDDPMPGRSEFEAYAGETRSAIIMLAAMVLDRGSAAGIAEAAGHAGVAQTAAYVLRTEDIHRARHQVYIPADLLAATGVEPNQWLSGGAEADRARQAFVAFAKEHSAKVEALWEVVPRSVRPALLPSLSSGDEFDENRSIGPLRRLWVFWRAMRR